MATAVDLIGIAQDIAQESCYHIPISKPEWIVQRRYVFLAATDVKEMCKLASDKKEVAILVLYAALFVDYAANFSPKSSMSERMRCVLGSATILPLSRSLTVFAQGHGCIRRDKRYIEKHGA